MAPTANAPWFEVWLGPYDTVEEPAGHRSAGCVKVREQTDATEVLYEYDENGWLQAKVIRGERQIMDHDECGRVVAIREEGTRTPSYSYSYDASGRLVTEVIHHSWGDLEQHYRWDANGELAERWYEQEGRKDESYVYDRDTAGRPLRMEHHQFQEGEVEEFVLEVKTWMYNERGQVIEAEQDGVLPMVSSESYGGAPANGVPDITATWTYDDQGQLLRYTWDQPYLNLLPYSLDAGKTGTYTFTWSPDGLWTAYEVDYGNDGVINHRSTFTYPSPRVRMEARDDDWPPNDGIDGVIDMVETVTVDAERLILSEVLETADGEVRDSWTAWHDCSNGQPP